MSASLPLARYIDAVRYGRPLGDVKAPLSREDEQAWLAEIVALPLDDLRHLLGQVARAYPETADEVAAFLALREFAADQAVPLLRVPFCLLRGAVAAAGRPCTILRCAPPLAPWLTGMAPGRYTALI